MQHELEIPPPRLSLSAETFVAVEPLIQMSAKEVTSSSVESFLT